MKHSFPTGVLMLLCLVVSLSAAQQTTGAEDQSQFLRLTHDDTGLPLALQAAVVSYRSGDEAGLPYSVDLVGALHIAEAHFYAELNRRFEEYDAVLYELIAPPGAQVPGSGSGELSGLSNMQVAMKNALGLAFQLEEIDYSGANFVHADMSPEQIAASMASRNESLYGYFWKIFFFAAKEYGKDPLGAGNPDLLEVLFAPDRQRQLKVEMARELLQMDTVTRALEGRDGSTFIAERNKHALFVLRKRIDAGDGRIAIFYGAGHLADLQRRLVDEFQLQRMQTDWIDAWDLRATTKQ